MVVARETMNLSQLAGRQIAVPGELTSAFLALRLCLSVDFQYTIVPFDEIISAVVAGEFRGAPIAAGLIIHEGQLTYGDRGLELIVDLGRWWQDETGLPLPLGANAVRKDLGDEAIRQIQRLLHASIQYGLNHREEALAYAGQFGRDLDPQRADRFVGMYVNDWTLDFGPRGRKAVAQFLQRGYEAGAIPELVVPEFVQ
jgi:1,4-dihydroxy-6-naphthoate synthase